MANDRIDKNQQKEEKNSIQPDLQTVHTTDPQKHMEGPVSSLMHETGESFETNETQEEVNDEKEKNM